MSAIVKLTGAEFDAMVLRGAFDCIGPKRVELIHGELRFKNQAGPLHDDLIDYLNRWSVTSTSDGEANVRVQCGFICDDHSPEPDILWLKPWSMDGIDLLWTAGESPAQLRLDTNVARNRKRVGGDTDPLLLFSSDRSRHDTEPLRDWRRSSVLLHSPMMIQANAK